MSCHGWSGASAISGYATLTGARAVNAVNVAQIVIAGMQRKSPPGVPQMPALGSAYSNLDIAAELNYVTARFGLRASRISAKEVRKLREASGQ
jgi:hypothetical protein